METQAAEEPVIKTQILNLLQPSLLQVLRQVLVIKSQAHQKVHLPILINLQQKIKEIMDIFKVKPHRIRQDQTHMQI
jgi:hypothetical protein